MILKLGDTVQIRYPLKSVPRTDWSDPFNPPDLVLTTVTLSTQEMLTAAQRGQWPLVLKLHIGALTTHMPDHTEHTLRALVGALIGVLGNLHNLRSDHPNLPIIEAALSAAIARLHPADQPNPTW